MEGYIADWLNLLIRWLHLITGAAWIGTSFYFNWLNHNIRPPEQERKGISGELFAVHGGHFYQVSKYAGAPEELPNSALVPQELLETSLAVLTKGQLLANSRASSLWLDNALYFGWIRPSWIRKIAMLKCI